MELEHVQPLNERKDLKIIPMKWYFTFPKSLKFEPHYQMQFIFIPKAPLLGARGSYHSAVN